MLWREVVGTFDRCPWELFSQERETYNSMYAPYLVPEVLHRHNILGVKLIVCPGFNKDAVLEPPLAKHYAALDVGILSDNVLWKPH